MHSKVADKPFGTKGGLLEVDASIKWYLEKVPDDDFNYIFFKKQLENGSN